MVKFSCRSDVGNTLDKPYLYLEVENHCVFSFAAIAITYVANNRLEQSNISIVNSNSESIVDSIVIMNDCNCFDCKNIS